MDDEVEENSEKPSVDLGFDAESDVPGVTIQPLVVYACSLVAGLVMHWIWPIGVIWGWASCWLGAGLVVGAFVLFGFAVREMLMAETNIPPYRPSLVLVKTGPYRFSRNPIYLSMTLLQVGIGVWVNSLWVVGLVVLAMVVMVRAVIVKEERYLEKKFGYDYGWYKAMTGRWL